MAVEKSSAATQHSSSIPQQAAATRASTEPGPPASLCGPLRQEALAPPVPHRAQARKLVVMDPGERIRPFRYLIRGRDAEYTDAISLARA